MNLSIAMSETTELLNCIRNEVLTLFTIDELKKIKTFEDFFNKIDTVNFYESDWDKDYYEVYYRVIWIELIMQFMMEKYSNLITDINIQRMEVNANE